MRRRGCVEELEVQCRKKEKEQIGLKGRVTRNWEGGNREWQQEGGGRRDGSGQEGGV